MAARRTELALKLANGDKIAQDARALFGLGAIESLRT